MSTYLPYACYCVICLLHIRIWYYDAFLINFAACLSPDRVCNRCVVKYSYLLLRIKYYFLKSKVLLVFKRNTFSLQNWNSDQCNQYFSVFFSKIIPIRTIFQRKFIDSGLIANEICCVKREMSHALRLMTNCDGLLETLSG